MTGLHAETPQRGATGHRIIPHGACPQAAANTLVVEDTQASDDFHRKVNGPYFFTRRGEGRTEAQEE